MVDWSNNASDVQEAWNDFEHKLIKVVDMVAPIVELNDEYFINKPCPIIKNKLNLRGRLLKIQKNRPTLELKKCIKNLGIKIKNHFHSVKRNKI